MKATKFVFDLQLVCFTWNKEMSLHLCGWGYHRALGFSVHTYIDTRIFCEQHQVSKRRFEHVHTIDGECFAIKRYNMSTRMSFGIVLLLWARKQGCGAFVYVNSCCHKDARTSNVYFQGWSHRAICFREYPAISRLLYRHIYVDFGIYFQSVVPTPCFQ